MVEQSDRISILRALVSQMESGELSRRDAQLVFPNSCLYGKLVKKSKAQWLHNEDEGAGTREHSSALCPLPGVTGGITQGPSSFFLELCRE